MRRSAEPVGARLLLLAVLLPVLAALAGCGGGGEPDAAAAGEPPRKLSEEAQKAIDELDANGRQVETPEEQVREKLAERAVALARGDAYALRATSMGTPQQARDRRWTRWMRGAPLAALRYTAADVQVDGDRATAQVTMRYRMRGVPRPFITFREMELEDNTNWVIRSDRGVGEQAPWEVAPFTARRSRHIVLLTAPGARVPDLLGDLERAYRKITRTLPRRPLPERVLAVALASVDQGRRFTRFYNGSVAAMDDVTYRFGPLPAGAVQEVLSQRVLIDARFFRRTARAIRRPMLAHELVHVALDPKAAQRTPAWLFEGLAMYLAGERLGGPDVAAEGAAVARAQDIGISDLCDPDAISERRGNAQWNAYVVSTAAVDAIVQRHGRRGALALHDAFRDESITGSACRATELALRDRLGMSIEELDRAIAAG